MDLVSREQQTDSIWSGPAYRKQARLLSPGRPAAALSPSVSTLKSQQQKQEPMPARSSPQCQCRSAVESSAQAPLAARPTQSLCRRSFLLRRALHRAASGPSSVPGGQHRLQGSAPRPRPNTPASPAPPVPRGGGTSQGTELGRPVGIMWAMGGAFRKLSL